MTRASPIQNATNAGELSTLLLGRQELDKYGKGLYVCLNAVPLAQGPWTRRPGFAFMHGTRHNDKQSRLIPFQYSTTQTYQLEFGEYYIRFHTGHGILVGTDQSITSISKAATGVVTKVAHGYANGARLQLDSIAGMTQLANREVVVTNKTADTFELYDVDGNAIDTTAYDTFTGGNMAPIIEVTTAFAEADVALIRTVQSADTLYILHPDFKPQTLTRVSATSWTLADIAFTDGPYDIVNDTATTITPSTATNVTPVAITNCADNGSGLIRVTSNTHLLATNDYVVITGVGGTTEANGYWKVTVIDPNTYDLVGSTFTNAYTTGGTGSELVTLTASAVTGINSDTGFQTTDVGRLIRIQEGTTWGYGEIAFRVSTTVVVADIFSTLTNTNAKTNWRLGLWSDTTGYPKCGTFYEDRLVLGGAAVYPQRFDMSVTSEYTNFAPSSTAGTVADSSAIGYNLNSAEVNAIQWMAGSDKGMLVGTTGGEWPVRPSSQAAALTPTNVSAKPSSKYGSADLPAVDAGRTVLFVQRGDRKVRELAYVIEIDGFKAPDMTLLANHVTKGGITDLAYQAIPHQILWAPRADGTLLGFTYERDQDVVGWHRHELGGYSDAAGLLIPVIDSVCVTASPDGTRDELYAIVKRYIDGGEKRYIEYMTKFWEEGDAQEDAFHLDCGWTGIASPAASTVTGLWHLEGETVAVYADGAYASDKTVTNGKITLDSAASVVTLGYPYNSDGQTMPIEAGAQDGTSQGKKKRVIRLGFWLVDTLGFQFGSDVATLDEYSFRVWNDLYGSAPSLYTGVIRSPLAADSDRVGQVYWRCSGPFPATVAAIMPQVETSDDS